MRKAMILRDLAALLENQMNTRITLKMANHLKVEMALMRADHGGSCTTISCKSSVSTTQTTLIVATLRT